MPGLGLGYGTFRRRLMGSGAVVLPFSSVNAAGWSVEYSSTPPGLNPLSSFFVTRQGFDATGTATTFADTLVATQRVRVAGTTELSSLTVAASDYAYSTDTILGVTNNSTEASPKPVAQWVTADHAVVGDTLTVELVAYHRDARNNLPVACVVGTATDGTNTVTATSATPIVLAHPQDRNAVIGYRLTFNVASLTDNATVTVNAKVYPRVGTVASGSVLDSAAGTADTWGFCPQVYYRSTSLAANPKYVYVDATNGNDTTGVASTNAATASASPCLTWIGAVSKLRGSTAGAASGGIVRVKASGGTLALGTTSATFQVYQGVGETIIESDPSGSTATVSWNSAINTYCPYIRWRNLNMVRAGNVALPNGTISTTYARWTLENVTVDGGGFASALAGAQRTIRIIGMTLTNAGSQVLTIAATANTNGYGYTLIRGLYTTISMLETEMQCFVGSYCVNGARRATSTARMPSGNIIAYNRFMNITGSSVAFGWGGTGTGSEVNTLVATLGGTAPLTVTGLVFVQNAVEKADAANAASFRLSGDGDGFNIVHPIVWNNTFAGFSLQGRANTLYDENSSYVRNYKLSSFRGNLWSQLNNKSDIFINDATHIGNWAYHYGVGCYSEFTQFAAADASVPSSGASFSQDYGGLGSTWAPQQYVRTDPLFVSYQGTTGTSGGVVSAGTGGGDYHLTSSSPCLGKITSAVQPLGYDLDGTARTRGSVGAYA